MEWDAHTAIIAKCAGFQAEKLEILKQAVPDGPGALSRQEWAVLRYCDAITSKVKVSEDIFHALVEAGFREQEIVEITLTCAAYNMVSRFIVPLDIGELNEKAPDFVAEDLA
jgi:alkylhydroperoxidase family enzyme